MVPGSPRALSATKGAGARQKFSDRCSSYMAIAPRRFRGEVRRGMPDRRSSGRDLFQRRSTPRCVWARARRSRRAPEVFALVWFGGYCFSGLCSMDFGWVTLSSPLAINAAQLLSCAPPGSANRRRGGVRSAPSATAAATRNATGPASGAT